MAVFVLDKRTKPLMRRPEKRARLLLKRRRAVVHRRRPLTIRLKDRVGFRAGDLVRAEVPNGKQAGVRVGCIDVRASRSFTVGDADAINAKYCKLLDRADGYGCAWRPALAPPAEAGGLERGRLG